MTTNMIITKDNNNDENNDNIKIRQLQNMTMFIIYMVFITVIMIKDYSLH